MQKIIAVGHLGNDAEVKDLGTTQVINFNLAVTETVKNEKVTTWYKCAYFTNNAAIAPWLTKGSLIGIDGRPEIETYTGSDGILRANLKAIVREIKLYSSTKDKNNAPAPAPATQQQQQPPQQTNFAPSPVANAEEEADDLPF